MTDTLVGPILQAGSPLTAAITSAIQKANHDVVLIDRGSYIRVLAPGECRLDAIDVESILGVPFQLPSDLESAMSSFKGRLSFSPGQALWSMPGEKA